MDYIKALAAKDFYDSKLVTKLVKELEKNNIKMIYKEYEVRENDSLGEHIKVIDIFRKIFDKDEEYLQKILKTDYDDFYKYFLCRLNSIATNTKEAQEELFKELQSIATTPMEKYLLKKDIKTFKNASDAQSHGYSQISIELILFTIIKYHPEELENYLMKWRKKQAKEIMTRVKEDYDKVFNK